jgi:thioredoxin 1
MRRGKVRRQVRNALGRLEKSLCRSDLPKLEKTMSQALEVNDQSFEKEVLQADLPVLVDFWAPWCGPCRMVAPVVDDIAGQYDGRLKVVKLNTDDSPNTAVRYQIMSIPTLLLFKNGKAVEQIVGAQPKQAMVGKIEPHLS